MRDLMGDLMDVKVEGLAYVDAQPHFVLLVISHHHHHTRTYYELASTNCTT